MSDDLAQTACDMQRLEERKCGSARCKPWHTRHVRKKNSPGQLAQG